MFVKQHLIYDTVALAKFLHIKYLRLSTRP